MPYFGIDSGYRPFCSYWWKFQLNPWTYYRAVKWFFQRAIRGWANCDVWSMDNYLNDILPGMLRRLKIGCSYPMDMTPEEWLNILEEMAVGFESGNKIDDCFDPNEEKELRAKFDRGMELFVKYYNHLWD